MRAGERTLFPVSFREKFSRMAMRMMGSWFLTVTVLSQKVPTVLLANFLQIVRYKPFPIIRSSAASSIRRFWIR